MNSTPAAAPSQCDIILAELQAHPAEWISILTLHQASGSMAVHSRIADLRERGHTIEQRSKRVGRMIHSSYRLIPPAPPFLV